MLGGSSTACLQSDSRLGLLASYIVHRGFGVNKRDEERDTPTFSVRQFVIDMAGCVHLPDASSVGDAKKILSANKCRNLDGVWYQPASVFGRGTCFEIVTERPGSAEKLSVQHTPSCAGAQTAARLAAGCTRTHTLAV